MKTNNKKKIIVSTLAVAMGAALVGSISGSVAWYQYSTRTFASMVGTSAGTTRNLQISKTGTSGWTQYIDDISGNLKPVSALVSSNEVSAFKAHPVYQYANLPDADGTEYLQFDLYFQCLDQTTDNTTAHSVAKEVYLTSLSITPKTGDNDITPAVRMAIKGTSNKFIVATSEGTTATKGNLDLNSNTKDDTDAFGGEDLTGNKIEYTTGANSYDAVAPSSVVAGDDDPYAFTNKDGRLLATTGGSNNKVTITVWLEGWAELGGSSVWSYADYVNQHFNIDMRFAVEADRD